ncbi:hypothetical protein DKM44_10945 [Deinococcus irradiatisoli]|uniref:Uncharacterized protein n=1 Tax=Deinococcus irradiatisoli TaxID=2202254 RepID=A0A2Z3JJB6_9DEIO|nr:hypothetical protein [Deinococcus irradiatisoli]AWN23681.1 hypothetical protein DKM44_10945 [Deinococcus irradiatisoli]
MAYQGTLPSGQTIVIENRGDQTVIRLSREGQRQSSSTSSGLWSRAPRVWQIEDAAVVQIETQSDRKYFSVKGGQFQTLSQAPTLAGAEPVNLEEVQDGRGESEMKPM